MKMLLAVMIAAVCALTAQVGTGARLVDVEQSPVFIVAVTPTNEPSVWFAAVPPTVDEAPSTTTSVVPEAVEPTTTTTIAETSSTTTSVASEATAPTTTVAETPSTTTSVGPRQDPCPATGSTPASVGPSTTSPANLDGRC